jgi:CYTH domain-containing protein
MSSPAGLYNIVANQGATFSRTILWRDPAKKPILMQGYTARMQVRKTTDSPVVLELTTENGRISLHETNGEISLVVPDEIMTSIPEDKYLYDLELIGPTADIYVYKLLQGNFVVRSEVTR